MDDSETSKESGRIFYGWWIVAACFLLLFLMAGAGFYSFSIFIKPLEENFGWSRTSISLTMTIYFLLSGFMGPLVGKGTETLGPKKIMSLSALCFGACFILVSFTQSLWYFYLMYAILAVTHSGMAFIPVSSVLAKWFVRRRGTAIGSAMVGIAVGGLVLAPVVSYITSIFGWRMAFVFLGLLTWVLALPLTLFVIKASPAEMGLLPDGDVPDAGGDSTFFNEDKQDPLANDEKEYSLSAALQTKAFWWLAGTYFLVPLAQMGVLQHQVPLIMDAGISQAAAATALGLTAGIGGLGKLSFGRISEILPIQYAALICFGMQALGVIFLLNAQTLSMVWIYVFVFGFAMGGVIVLLPLIVGRYFGMASFGVILGSLSITQALGGSIGSVVSGIIYDALGSYQYALFCFVAIYLAAILTVFLAGKPQRFSRV